VNRIPNPVASLRQLLTSLLVRGQLVIPVAAMLVILLIAVWVSNKSICGWACQLGLLQDLLHRVNLPKWEPPFWLSNTVRILAFEMDGISLIAIIYVPVDVPTLPGTELVLWTSAWPLGPTMHMEFQGKVVPGDAIGDFTAAAGALQWALDDLDEFTWWAAFADFYKPVVTPLDLVDMQLDVDFWFVGNDGDGWPWTIDQTVVIDVERRAPMPPP